MNDCRIHGYKLDVFYEDTDAGGIVYHANYLKFTERARTILLKDNGLGHRFLLSDYGILLVVRSQNIEYLRPSYLDDNLIIKTVVLDIKKASFTLKQTIFRDDTVVVDSIVKIACIDLDGKLKKAPDILKNVLLNYQ